MMSIGLKAIEDYEAELTSYLYDSLEAVEGLTLYGPRERAALIAFNDSEVHPSDLATFLDLDDVAVRAGHHCAQPLHQVLGAPGSCRASLAFYNNRDDIDHFVKALKGSLDMLRAHPPDDRSTPPTEQIAELC
jgi:cysteine desulfurase/selenocysteine lyase